MKTVADRMDPAAVLEAVRANLPERFTVGDLDKSSRCHIWPSRWNRWNRWGLHLRVGKYRNLPKPDMWLLTRGDPAKYTAGRDPWMGDPGYQDALEGRDPDEATGAAIVAAVLADEAGVRRERLPWRPKPGDH